LAGARENEKPGGATDVDEHMLSTLSANWDGENATANTWGWGASLQPTSKVLQAYGEGVIAATKVMPAVKELVGM
jgi:hypothetical protein